MPDRVSSSFDAERLEARLSHLSEGLEAAGEELDRLHRLATIGTAAGMIAHEVRGLLTPVHAYAQLAQRTPDDRELVLKALAKAEQGSAAAVRISETILSLVAGIRGDEPVAEAPAAEVRRGVRVIEAVEAALEALAPVLDSAGVVARVEVEPSAWVAMGAVEFQQVLVNIFENGARAMEHGGELRVTAGSTRDTREVVVEIEDTGPGLDASIASRAFEPFVSGAQGSGLGLAVCRALVGHARGRISASSTPGAGARFRIVLPAG